jgi:hypothetical protein
MQKRHSIKLDNPYMIKTEQIRKEGTHFNIINAKYNKSSVSVTLIGENLKVFFLRSGTRQTYPLSPLLFNIVLKVYLFIFWWYWV